MPLLEHLLELRKRFVLIAAGLVLGAIAGWFLYDPLLVMLQRPLQYAADVTGNDVTLNFTGPASALDLRIRAALFLAVFLSCPWWLFQVWAFVTPGLNKREKYYAYGFVGASVPLFLGGAYMAWIVIPHAVQILTGFLPDNATNFTDAQMYLDLVMRLLLAFGVAFVSPVLLVGLNFAGLMSAKALLAGWRWAILIAFTFAAIVTPTPDALTMILVALPICVLYFGAVGVSVLHDRRVEKRLAAAEI
ncbi:twin-arginine translocase subunit TatC [Promicromonospora iranensis]|jgi:sec-independent protein translocase protein TatC|uniref:twin-arginine translocase subunit TatC n=1 Tax=Promicromonospora iranensis TaxID=1105144 RepID=UPI0023A97E32|nr:twin-arginine translocase subunit TatC [Promicromonospora iranensis]